MNPVPLEGTQVRDSLYAVEAKFYVQSFAPFRKGLGQRYGVILKITTVNYNIYCSFFIFPKFSASEEFVEHAPEKIEFFREHIYRLVFFGQAFLVLSLD